MTDTKIMVRHDAEVEVTFLNGVEVLDVTTTEAYLLAAHLTVRAAMYCANPYSGGGMWQDKHGRPIRRPKYRTRLVNPEKGQLIDGELCTCKAVCGF